MKLAKKWIALFIIFTPALHAAERLNASHTEVWLGLSQLNFDYEEFYDDGSTASMEEGLIPGITTGVSITQDSWFVSTGISLWTGDVDYHGPVESKTAEEIIGQHFSLTQVEADLPNAYGNVVGAMVVLQQGGAESIGFVTDPLDTYPVPE